MRSALTESCVVPAPGDAEPDWTRLPASRGVAVFESPGGTTSLIATTANVRALARRRLDPAPDATSVVNLRSVTGVVRAARTGSAFESDLIYLELARERLPHVYRSVTDRWQGWFLAIEPDAPYPRFVKTPTSAMHDAAASTRFFGPVADKHACARFIELLEDLFDLCRDYRILLQTPHGTACVYKEMGKCPAPCDGSEPMEAYRARLEESVRFATDPASAIRAGEAEMREASAALDFERAEARRRWLERAREATTRKHREMGDLAALRLIGVAPAERPGWARLFALAGGRWSILMDVRRDDPPADVGDLAGHALASLGPCAFSRPEMDRLGLLCTWLARSEKMRRGVRFVRLSDRFDEALIGAIRDDPTDASEDEEPTQEIGAPGTEEASPP